MSLARRTAAGLFNLGETRGFTFTPARSAAAAQFRNGASSHNGTASAMERPFPSQPRPLRRCGGLHTPVAGTRVFTPRYRALRAAASKKNGGLGVQRQMNSAYSPLPALRCAGRGRAL